VITLTQEFANPYDTDLEVVYTFPLPNRAAVTGFRAKLGDNEIEGLLKERSVARQTYDDAIANGQRAAITEQDRNDVFTTRVGNIAPGETAQVVLTLHLPLRIDNAQATLRIPTVVAPRYTAGSPLPLAPASDHPVPGADTDQVPDASRLVLARLNAEQPRPRLSGQVTIDSDFDRSTLVISQHASTQASATTGPLVITLSPDQRLDRDFILRFNLPTSLSTTALWADDPTPESATIEEIGQDGVDGESSAGESTTHQVEGTWSLTLIPPAPKKRTPRRVVVVLDRSGSMGGWKITAARRAACRIVDSLEASDSFAVLAFDHQIERPSTTSALVAATDVNRFEATSWLSNLQARGGTEMATPLLEAAALLSAPEPADSIILVTDGQITAEDALLASLVPTLGTTRIHIVGIDRAVNAGFIERLATQGSGTAELVESQERLDEVMTALHRRIIQPALTDIAVTPQACPGVEFDLDTTTPTIRPDAFEGLPCVISGRYRRTAQVTPQLRFEVSAASPTAPFKCLVTSNPTDSAAPQYTWARARIAELEDDYALADPAQRESLAAKIVGTSIRHHVLSRFTAFVAVDSRTRETTELARVTQPVETPDGWASANFLSLAGSHQSMGPVGGTATLNCVATNMSSSETIAGSSSRGYAGGYSSTLSAESLVDLSQSHIDVLGQSVRIAPAGSRHDQHLSLTPPPLSPESALDTLALTMLAMSLTELTTALSAATSPPPFTDKEAITRRASQCLASTQAYLDAHTDPTDPLRVVLESLRQALAQFIAVTNPTKKDYHELQTQLATATTAITGFAPPPGLDPNAQSSPRQFWA
jgi:hypothetical protein